MMVLLRVLTVASLAVQWFTTFKGYPVVSPTGRLAWFCVCTLREDKKNAEQ